ncbi:IS5 family transposase [Thermithiobacillus plumbiphilus]|uniref:IS5 family transposase n=1 Tax=Thermithiobacillus plumbiphilus TaxID=1729899 RepID=A0ABU9D5N7_9PROT
MNQLSFAEAEYQSKRRRTRREVFLARMEQLIPWAALEAQIAHHYPQGRQGRPPYRLSAMLRVHCLQLFYNLSDPAMEDALYEIASMRHFAGLRLSDPLPDETTILNFRHFLERHGLGQAVFAAVNQHLAQHGLILREGSILDASIIAAPSSTKNQSGQRDPEMHQTRKGNQWHFGMKLHIGVDDTLGLVHSLHTTPANVHDLTVADKLLHGKEQRAFTDAGYRGIERRPEHRDRALAWYIARRPGERSRLDAEQRQVERIKASIRAKVEHPFRYIKGVFGYDKVRYRGLARNTHRLYWLAAFANLLIGSRYLLPQD